MYKLTPNAFVVRLADSAYIPIEPGNADYQAYLAWCGAGNVPEPAPAPDPSVEAQRLLDALEHATMMNRLMREFMLVSMQDLAQRQSELLAEQGITMSAEDILSHNIGWNKLVALNQQAAELRERLV